MAMRTPAPTLPVWTRGERSATVKAGIWIIVRMQKPPRAETYFCRAAILGPTTTTLLVPKNLDHAARPQEPPKRASD